MIEALAMLGLISMVTPVIYKKAAERTTEMQDINAASQVRVIVKGIDDYLRDNYTTITAGGTVASNIANSSVDYKEFNTPDTDKEEKTVIIENITHFSDYLPLGFKPTGKLFKEFKVAIKQTKDPSGERKALTAVLVAKTDTTGKVDPSFTRLRSARIASMIGTNGGYVDKDATTGNEIATGVQGVWQIEKSKLPDTNVDAGTIVATSIEAVADGTAGGKNVLHRVLTPGRELYNTMETTLHMGGENIDQITNLIAAGDKVTIKRQSGETNASSSVTLQTEGDGVFERALYAAGNNAVGAAFTANRSYMQHTTGLFVGNNTDAACSSPDDTSCGAKFYVDGEDGRIRAATGNFTVSEEGNTTMAGFAEIGDYANIAGYLNALDSNFTVANKDGKPTLTFAKDVITADKDKITNNVPSFIVKNADGGTADFFNGMLNINAKDTEKPLLNNNVTVGTNLDVYGFVHIDNNAEIEGYLKASYTGDGHNFFSNSDSVRAGKMSGSDSDKYGLNVNAGTGTTIFEGKVIANKDGDKIFDIDDTTDGYTTAKYFHAGTVSGDDNNKKKYGLIANETGATIRFKDENSGFEILGSDNNYLMRAYGNGETYLASEGEDILKLYTKNAGNYRAQATFTSDMAFYNGSDNILTVSIDDSDGTEIDGGQGFVHIRRGALSVQEKDKPALLKIAPLSEIKSSDSNVKDKIDETGYYKEYSVNPAYTSMMHDIKLATRGGARLSDILPDFINKGIYVMDNTYYGKSDWTNSEDYPIEGENGDFKLRGLGECDKNSAKCDTSPWMGFIPTPNCPPNYMKVATITPIRFAMAQAGVPVSVQAEGNKVAGIMGINKDDVNLENYRLLGTRKDPRGDKIEVGRGSDFTRTGDTVVAIFENGEGNNIKSDGNLVSNPAPEYWAEVYNAPYTFQVSTWLNTTIKAYRDKKDAFRGWHGIMGFIYPANDYRDYAVAAGLGKSCPSGSSCDNEIYWNLFPVYKEELSAIATVYCYFDRTAFSDENVDQYLAHKQGSVANIRNSDKSYLPALYKEHLNDPTLNYNGVW